MSFNISDLLKKIDSEISQEYVGGCYQWVDKKYPGEHGKLLNDMDLAILEFEKTKNQSKLNDEFQMYYLKTMKWIREYKNEIPNNLKRDVMDIMRNELGV